MKKYKTNEEFVLDNLYKAQEQLEIANKKIEELEEQLKKPQNNDEELNVIYLSDKPNYFYCVDVASSYNWNKILKDNKKTPKFVEEALKDDKKLKKLYDLKENNDRWSAYTISKVDERIYNYLLKDRRGNYATITLWGDDDISLYQIRNQNFLDKERAEEYRKERVIATAKEYLKNYAEQFEETK